MRTLEQDRMQHSWDVLSGKSRFLMDKPFTDWPPEMRSRAKKYLTAVKRTAPRIYVSGLGQALAFLQSRGDDSAKEASADLSALTLVAFGLPGVDLLSRLREGQADFLFAATDEALEVCGWLSRYLLGAGVKPEDDE